MANEFNIKNGFISNADSKVIGGLTATTLNITTLGSNTPINNLGVDTNGNVVVGTTTYGGNYLPLSGGTVYGPTIYTSGLTANTVHTDWIDFNLNAMSLSAFTHEEGRLHWNDDSKTLEIDTEVVNFSVEIGQENVVRVSNQTGSILTRGTVVYITGATISNVPSVNKSSMDSEQSSAKTLGLIGNDINSGDNGYVITYGLLRDINTLSYSPGTSIYLYTGGTWSNIKPIAPNHYVRIGTVIRQDSGAGSIFINVQNGFELDEIHNVQISGTTNNNEVLSYNLSDDLWKPSFIPPIGANEVFRGRTFRHNETTADTYGGLDTLNNASAQAITPNTTLFGNRFTRLRYYASVVTTGRVTSIRSVDLQWYLSSGFRFITTFRVADTVFGSTCQQFYGMVGTIAEIVVGGAGLIQVSTLTNIIGVGNDGSDTNLQVMHNDASGTATKIDLGSGFPANRTAGSEMTTMYSIEIYNQVGTTDVKYRVVNLESGDVAQGIITTNLPSTTQGLAIQAARVMGTPTTNTGQFELHKWGCYDITY